MKLITLKEIRELSKTEINDKIIEIRKEIFDLKLKQATKKTIKTHLFKVYKRNLAQLLTIKSNNK